MLAGDGEEEEGDVNKLKEEEAKSRRQALEEAKKVRDEEKKRLLEDARRRSLLHKKEKHREWLQMQSLPAPDIVAPVPAVSEAWRNTSSPSGRAEKRETETCESERLEAERRNAERRQSERQKVNAALGATLGASLRKPIAPLGTSSGPPRRRSCPPSSPPASAQRPGRLRQRLPGPSTTLVHAMTMASVVPTPPPVEEELDEFEKDVESRRRAELELLKSKDEELKSSYPKAARDDLHGKLKRFEVTKELPRIESLERLQEEEVRKRNELPYPFRITPGGSPAPVMPGGSITAAHLADTWTDWDRQERWLQQAWNDAATGRVASEACSNRALGLRLGTHAPPGNLKPWPGTAFMTLRPLRKQEAETRWRESRVIQAPLRVLTL